MTCLKCGATMDLAEKDTSSGRDIREYTCSQCGHSDWEDRGPALWQILHDDRERHAAASPPPPVPAIQTPQSNTFAHQAAKGSWIVCICILIFNNFGRRVAGWGVIVELIVLVGIVVGLVLGMIALFGIRKYGAKGILANALVGIIINALFLLIFVTDFLASWRHG